MARLTIVGNPENRRVGLFREAVRAAGEPEPTIVAWRDVVAGRPVAIEPESLVRLDSPGEDGEVDRRLRGAAEPAQPGEIVGLAAWYVGFGQALARVAAAVRDADATLLQDPAEILTMFDKRATHAMLTAAGVPVPAALASPSSYVELRRSMATAGWRRVFVKPAHGSSASGVLALQTSDTRVRVSTSVELDDARLFNSLRVRTYDDERAIESIVDRLAPDGLHVERWYPKASLDGRVLDLRVVVIGGRATHAVVRTSLSPMTNLHLGGARGDLGRVRAAVGESGWRAALETCERVAACFPGSLQVGVDLMFSVDWTDHAVAEVNAFGDLLPNLLDLHGEGQDTYAAQLAEVLRRGPYTARNVKKGTFLNTPGAGAVGAWT